MLIKLFGKRIIVFIYLHINLKLYNMENEVKQVIARRQRIYNFDGLELGVWRAFGGVRTSVLHNCAKSYALKRGLNWKFRVFKIDGITYLIRVI
jgi:hypothetical protein